MSSVSIAFATASAHHQAGRLSDAEEIYRQILATEPGNAQAWHMLGVIAYQTNKDSVAIEFITHALELNPKMPSALNNLGLAYQRSGKPHLALASYRQAIQINETYAHAIYNVGNIARELGNFDEALACCNRAIELDPIAPEPHLCRATLNLLRGDFEAGWPEYEWRWKSRKMSERDFCQPRWNGDPLAGQTILLHAEQGFGDTIQFIRYAQIVRSMGGKVVVECQKPLVNLLSTCPGIDQLVSAGREMPAFDLQAALLSLPAILRTTLTNIPATIPYLFADSRLIAHWREKLRELSDFRVGINWRGGENGVESDRRNVPPELMASLADIPGVQLISLQRGAGESDLKAAAGNLPIIDLGEFDRKHGAFVDTAAVMKNLNLVITSDTSVPHLAGALGVPVWTALPFVPDWRWLLNRADSPWYPTMRLFRQKLLGDWRGVFSEIKSELRAYPRSDLDAVSPFLVDSGIPLSLVLGVPAWKPLRERPISRISPTLNGKLSLRSYHRPSMAGGRGP